MDAAGRPNTFGIIAAIGIVVYSTLTLLSPENRIPKTPITIHSQPQLSWFEQLSWHPVMPNAPWSPRDSHAAAVFNDKLWLFGGVNGNGFVEKNGFTKYWEAPHMSDAWNSEDGIHWTQIAQENPWLQRRSMSVIEYKGKLLLLGGWSPINGYKSDIWSSEDGVAWIREKGAAQWPPREGQSVIAFQNKLWLLGGVNYDTRKTYNDVWFSDDGIEWTQATSIAAWSGRWDHAITELNGALYLAGGMDLQHRTFGDVWRSDNGADWERVTENAPWAQRQGHALITYRDRMWIIGRLNDDENGGQNDVWMSENGIDWKKTDDDPGWTGREDFSALVFQDAIWIMGGMDRNLEWKNDIWISQL